jgi:hypothetical protein
MIAENKKDQSSEIQSSTLFADSIKADISLLDSKIEKLMSAYLESALSLEEYREAKNKLVNQNQLLKEKLSAFEQKANNRFELTEKFLKCNMELTNDRTRSVENPFRFRIFWGECISVAPSARPRFGFQCRLSILAVFFD